MMIPDTDSGLLFGPPSIALPIISTTADCRLYIYSLQAYRSHKMFIKQIFDTKMSLCWT